MHSQFLRSKHKVFLKRCLDVLPEPYEQLDTTRLTLLFFSLSGLDVLNGLDDISESRKKEIISWIYSLQVSPIVKNGTGGFRGTFTNASVKDKSLNLYDSGHLAMTYTGLACLLILGDDFSNVDRSGVLDSVRSCQLDDGSFCAHPGGSENDMRFVYCAVAICYILDDFRPLNVQKLVDFILHSFNYDGGFGQNPHCESHGGSTFCAIASLFMLNKLDAVGESRRRKLIRWCVFRQCNGFHGRPNKPDDSCYSFWIGSTLHILNSMHFVDIDKIVEFTLSTQDELVGGFSKYPDSTPDALHTYLSLAGMSVMNVDAVSLQKLHPALNFTQRAFDFLKNIRCNFTTGNENRQAK